MLVEGLYLYLTADAGVRAQFGSSAPRVFPLQAPDEVAVPWIVYQQVSGQPLQTSMQGTGRLGTARFRFTCYGSTYVQAKKLAQAVKYAMLACDGGLPGSTTYAEVHGSWLALEMDEAQPMPKGTIFATHLDFMLIAVDVQP